jgi:hypothetical protein
VGAESVGAVVVRVRAGADPASADGSADHPFATLAAAAAAAGDGAWLLVAAGTYPGALEVTGVLHVVGVCAPRVTIAATTATAALVAHGAGARVDVRGVTAAGVSVADGGQLTLAHVQIAGAPGIGVSASGAQLRATDVVVLGDPGGSWGVLANSGAAVVASRVVLVGNVGAGLVALENATVALSDSVVRDQRPSAMGGDGYGLVAGQAAQLTLVRGVVDANTNAGISATDADTHLVLTDAVIRGTLPSQPDRTRGYGIYAVARATVDATRALVTSNRTAGVHVENRGTVVALTESVVRSTQAQASDGSGGWGITLADRGALVASRTQIADNLEAGLYATQYASAMLTDCLVAATRSQLSDGRFGYGIDAEGGTQLTGTGVLIDDNRAAGVLLRDAVTHVVLTDSAVRGTRPHALDGHTGFGIDVGLQAQLTGARLLITDNSVAGLVARDPRTAVVMDDVRVERTRPDAVDQTSGRGLVFLDGCTGSLGHVRAELNADAALRASGTGTLVRISESALVDTLPQASDLRRGIGLDAALGAAVVGRGLLITGSHAEGVLALDPATDVRVSDSIVRATHPRVADRGGGEGVAAGTGASVSLERVLVEGNREAGVEASDVGTSVSLASAVVAETLPSAFDGHLGVGLEVVGGAGLVASAVLIRANRTAGLLVDGVGSRVVVSDSAVSDTASDSVSLAAGMGVVLQNGAQGQLRRCLVDRNREAGLFVISPGTVADASDVVLSNVSPSARGAGFGAVVGGGATLSGSRIAAVNTGGAAICATFPSSGDVDQLGGTVRIEDLFVQRVTPSTIQFDSATHPSGPLAAYGLHAGTHSSVAVRNAVLAEGGLGFYRGAGTLELHSAVIASQATSAGATSGDDGLYPLILDGVHFQSNASDEVRRNAGLPEADQPPPLAAHVSLDGTS